MDEETMPDRADLDIYLFPFGYRDVFICCPTCGDQRDVLLPTGIHITGVCDACGTRFPVIIWPGRPSDGIWILGSFPPHMMCIPYEEFED